MKENILRASHNKNNVRTFCEKHFNYTPNSYFKFERFQSLPRRTPFSELAVVPQVGSSFRGSLARSTSSPRIRDGCFRECFPSSSTSGSCWWLAGGRSCKNWNTNYNGRVCLCNLSFCARQLLLHVSRSRHHWGGEWGRREFTWDPCDSHSHTRWKLYTVFTQTPIMALRVQFYSSKTKCLKTKGLWTNNHITSVCASSSRTGRSIWLSVRYSHWG